MKIWHDDPSTALQDVFGDIAATRMADLPIVNRALSVEAIGFRRYSDRHWIGALVTPWAINLLRLPGATAGWPSASGGAGVDWRFPSGDYSFLVAEEARLGVYHLCSLFSPVLEFESMEAACATALAALLALLRPPMTLPEALPEALPEDAAPAAEPSRRRWLLGRAREGGR